MHKQGLVLLIKKDNNTLVGGFTQLGWTNNSAYQHDPCAFLFRLVQGGAEVNIKSTFPQNTTNGIYCTANNIAFGGGHDISLGNNGTCYSVPSTYKFPDGQNAFGADTVNGT